ncbi:hypothetical protein [Anaerotalea alkaliphila]|uniref:Uncharacterized protein n=1 Tax=Anaerotalea alkaliphila TaxID=2662126 RepID=A0A7X5HXH2_9FIRM|nr:hypothetical protein [Anaerotalea alkaliphila]NDL68465.1 hypothetical protein [Anaerotalea alkaliphila]
MERKERQQNGADQLARNIRKAGRAGGLFRLVRGIGFSLFFLILAVFLVSIGMPWYIGAAMLVAAIGMVFTEVKWLKKIGSVDLDVPLEPVPGKVELDPGEELVDAIPAVMRYGTTRSAVAFGTGEVLTPENALLITNKAIWALTVPLAGTDKVVAGMDIGKWQWTTAYGEIGVRLQEMLADLPLEEVLRQGRAMRLMRREELKAAKTFPSTYAVSLEREDGKKFGYSVRVKEDYLRAKEIFGIR